MREAGMAPPAPNTIPPRFRESPDLARGHAGGPPAAGRYGRRSHSVSPADRQRRWPPSWPPDVVYTDVDDKPAGFSQPLAADRAARPPQVRRRHLHRRPLHGQRQGDRRHAGPGQSGPGGGLRLLSVLQTIAKVCSRSSILCGVSGDPSGQVRMASACAWQARIDPGGAARFDGLVDLRGARSGFNQGERSISLDQGVFVRQAERRRHTACQAWWKPPRRAWSFAMPSAAGSCLNRPVILARTRLSFWVRLAGHIRGRNLRFLQWLMHHEQEGLEKIRSAIAAGAFVAVTTAALPSPQRRHDVLERSEYPAAARQRFGQWKRRSHFAGLLSARAAICLRGLVRVDREDRS